MPHYHLHLHNAHVDATDEDGIEATDIAAARDQAIAGIRDFLAHEVMRGVLDLRGQVDVADHAGNIILSVPFMDVVTITKP